MTVLRPLPAAQKTDSEMLVTNSDHDEADEASPNRRPTSRPLVLKLHSLSSRVAALRSVAIPIAACRPHPAQREAVLAPGAQAALRAPARDRRRCGPGRRPDRDVVNGYGLPLLPSCMSLMHNPSCIIPHACPSCAFLSMSLMHNPHASNASLCMHGCTIQVFAPLAIVNSSGLPLLFGSTTRRAKKWGALQLQSLWRVPTAAVG